ncbi:prolipoprotein diacylglyceryl transferase [Rosistilla oblonga]|uniref:prolipoprotein diacylglyceryl transferase n=1 Tax=Rosistilla oblonga TaxID=2527990 RepID=UPI003A973FEB
MYRTLFFIPHEFAGIPLFGFGWLLGAIVLYAIAITIFSSRDPNRRSELFSTLGMCAIAAVVVAVVFPNVEIRNQADEPMGMAIRGYGVMMLLGVSAAVGLAIVRARKYGLGSETIMAAAPWLFVLGILGARAFYVIEYRDRFEHESMLQMLRSIVDFTRGGIVVYGSLIGGFVGLVLFCRRHSLPFFRMADIIIPCVFIGLFFGRMGCVMNGCCYGGRCEPSAYSMQFPKGSPVYEDQARSGDLLGLVVDWGDSDKSDSARLGKIVEVVPASLAAEAGVEPGGEVRIQLERPAPEDTDLTLPIDDTSGLGIAMFVDGKTYRWKADQLPQRANSVAPAQLYSSVLGLAMAVMLMVISPWIRREGALMGIGFAGYAVVRFGLESIRSDEPGQFGTGLTISQWVSIFVFVGSIGLLIYLYRRPLKTADPATVTASP